MRQLGSFMILVGCAGLLAGCAVNPATGKRELSLVSQDQEIAIGRDGHKAIIAEYGLYDDPEIQAHVQEMGMRLAKSSHLPNLEWHFTVLDDPVVNAFALPGGYIYITRGILAYLNSDAQLAGVLGHEIGHVTARHTAQRITQQQLAGLGLAVGMFFSSTMRRYGGNAETALGLLFLKFGRDDENQADELGVQYATATGFDPHEIPSTYSMLKRVGDQSGERLPGFLSTHPDPGDREQRTARLATEAATGKSGLVIDHDSYVLRLADLVYGQDPRNGFFVGASYYHPNLHLQIHLPEGWEYQDQRASLIAAEPNKQGVMEITLADAEGESPEGYVNSLLRSGRLTGAEGDTETIAGRRAWFGHVAAPRNDGSTAVILAAWIRWSPDQMLQILGQSARRGDQAERDIERSARSIRELKDPGKLNAEPDRVQVTRLDAPASFVEAVTRLGDQALDLQETAILNNRYTADDLETGELLKTVKPGRRG